MLTSIVGINWGDEGKGRMVDLISQEYDIVARYQGGNNAGHTVKNERGKFVLNLLPSGILRPNVVCVMGNGMVIDPHHLDGEINNLREQGISITPANLKISDRATITMPYHVDQDGLEEARRSDEQQDDEVDGGGDAPAGRFLSLFSNHRHLTPRPRQLRARTG